MSISRHSWFMYTDIDGLKVCYDQTIIKSRGVAIMKLIYVPVISWNNGKRVATNTTINSPIFSSIQLGVRAAFEASSSNFENFLHQQTPDK